MENNKKSVFETLNTINVSGKTEKKNGLTYLSWAYAWAEVKKLYPTAQYHVYERDTQQYGPVNYFTDGKTCWVKVGVTIEGMEHVEMLPVMNFKNQSIPLDKVTSCDVNKAIQRAITKAIGRQGLGLYIYAGEDLPEIESQSQPVVKPVEKATQPQAPALQQAPVKDTRPVTAQMVDIIKKTIEEHGVSKEFICKSYKIGKLEDLQVYQAKHICKNLDKLKQMFDNEKKEHLADIVKNTKPKEMPTSFNEAICSSQQKDDDKEPIDLESLGLTEKDIQELTDLGKVFS